MVYIKYFIVVRVKINATMYYIKLSLGLKCFVSGAEPMLD